MPNFGRNIIRRAFTLIELLVVIAIIAILAAILFPVFAQAKLAALKSVDITRFKQVGTATALYVEAFNGGYPLANSGGVGCWGCGPPDTVPGMQMMPYVKNTQVFTCPVDPLSDDARVTDHFKEMGWPASYKSRADYVMYARMTRTNMGYNYAFFSPWRIIRGSSQNAQSGSISESDIGSPSATIMFASSIWYRTPGTGKISGGGNWVIETPCWMDAGGKLLRPMSTYDADGTLFSYDHGWETPTKVPNSSSWLVYGGMWPFHNQSDLGSIQTGLKDGHVITQMADTSVKSMPVMRTIAGCSAYGSALRQGKVTEPDKFMWDLD